MSNEEVVRTACRVVWGEGDVARVPEFYADDFVAHPLPAGQDWGTGAEGLRTLAASLRAAFPDYHETIEDLVATGDRVVVRLTIRGTHTGPLPFLPPTGKAVEIADFSIFRMADGKIAEQWALTDHLTLLRQLGVREIPG